MSACVHPRVLLTIEAAVARSALAALHALLTVEANLQWQLLIVVLHIQDNLECHMRQGPKHSGPTYAYNYNKI